MRKRVGELFDRTEPEELMAMAASSKVKRFEEVEGHLVVDPAFGCANKLKFEITVGDKTTEREIPKRDRFAPELLHYSQCIIDGTEPEPSGYEGLADTLILEAINFKASQQVMICTNPAMKQAAILAYSDFICAQRHRGRPSLD